MIMTQCPNCKKEIGRPTKAWKYGKFRVQVYLCNCGTRFREYTRDGKHSFMLKFEKGRGFIKA